MMTKIKRMAVYFFLFAGTACSSGTQSDQLKLYDIQGQNIYKRSEAVDRLQQARVVLVGEHHNNPVHHAAQLAVIKALHQSGRKVAVGLEMFRQQSQPLLDQWVSGESTEAAFKPVYLDNWNYAWPLYRLIFVYARENRIPLIGLNVPRQITNQVAYHGFDSLTEQQKGQLENITCNVTESYRDFVQQAYGAHGHGGMQFERFCEAQLVWDTAMAVRAIGYLEQHPDHIMVILAGSGHARKMGIPAQIKVRRKWPVLVILPLSPGKMDKVHLTPEQADYLLVD